MLKVKTLDNKTIGSVFNKSPVLYAKKTVSFNDNIEVIIIPANSSKASDADVDEDKLDSASDTYDVQRQIKSAPTDDRVAKELLIEEVYKDKTISYETRVSGESFLGVMEELKEGPLDKDLTANIQKATENAKESEKQWYQGSTVDFVVDKMACDPMDIIPFDD